MSGFGPEVISSILIGVVMENLIEGLQILNKYKRSGVDAQHDIIYAGPPNGSVIMKDDKKRLLEIGWGFDEENDSWYYFT